METYDIIIIKFYQKSLLVSFYYPPEWLLRQYINMSNFIICGVFQMFFTYKVQNVIKGGFHRSQTYHVCYEMSHFMRKTVFGFPPWPDTNRTVKPQKVVRGLEFRI